ncbi:hypothetical protein AA0118_g9149 [Alternaria tenuissima]|jgi:hypothetical protein|nr:hypothetical protein AA0118_g9149 [Alternaria tenuissima]
MFLQGSIIEDHWDRTVDGHGFFFYILLVFVTFVISESIILVITYALIVHRSRIERRCQRERESLVEQLPVRNYQTIGTSDEESSITSVERPPVRHHRNVDTSDDGGGITRLSMIKSWIEACDEHHGSNCHIPKADASIWPMWVVDVVDECVVKGDNADRYLTLSYVWGRVQTLQATTGNIEQLKQPGSLTEGKVALPKTIRQAIDVTRLLGERYIWIDQLSILQDDYEHKHSQIKHMAEIYANSYLTLVAITGDTAEVGLSHDMNRMLNEVPLSENENEYKSIHFMDIYSIWNRRGW